VDVYLHLGAHRTGTTAFQAFLQANRARLAARGTALWLPADLRGGPLEALAARPGGRARALADLPLKRHLAQALARLEAAGHGRLIVSEENLLGTMAGCLAAAAPYPQAGARLARLGRLFSGRIVRVGIGLRGYDTWWASVMAFRLLRGGPVPDAALLDRLARSPRGWAEVLEEIRAALPGRPVACWRFEACVNRPQRVLARLTGEPAPAAMLPAGHGRNAAPCAARLAAHLADRGAPVLPPGLAAPAGDRWRPFSQGQAEALAARYEADLARLQGDRMAGLDCTG